MIPHPPFSLTSPLVHCLCLSVRSKVRAMGRARRKRGSDETLPPPPHCRSALWWRWEWVEVLTQSAITLRWKLASKTLCSSQKSRIMKALQSIPVVLLVVEIISEMFYGWNVSSLCVGLWFETPEDKRKTTKRFNQGSSGKTQFGLISQKQYCINVMNKPKDKRLFWWFKHWWFKDY